MVNDGARRSSNQQYPLVRTKKQNCHRHTPQQIQRLEAYFKECPHPEESQRQRLCRELNLEPGQVKFWFQNKRTQSKTQGERSCNILLRGENEKMISENEALLEAVRNVLCPPCGGPPFCSTDQRHHIIQYARFQNSLLKEKRNAFKDFIAKHMHDQSTMTDSLASPHQQQSLMDTHDISYETNLDEPRGSLAPPASLQTIRSQILSRMDITKLPEIAASAVEEVKRLCFTEEAIWVKSSVDGTCVIIDQEMYENFSRAIRIVTSSKTRVESSKESSVVAMEATNLIQLFLDTDKWKKLFQTIVNKAMTIHMVEYALPINENCNVVQLIWEQQHILSPLVPAREFMTVRCCQQIGEGLWIIADVSHSIIEFDKVNQTCCKRPSGCLIRALPNGHSEVTWIEHVEVDEKFDAHWMYKDLLFGGGLGYGAKRWIVSLQRMCERISLSSILTIPSNDYLNEIIPSVEGRMSVMKLGERMLMNFNEMLTMSGNVDFPHQTNCGVRVSIRMSSDPGQPAGLVVSAASCFSMPLSPLQVFNSMRSNDTRHQWDVLCYGNAVAEIARVFTGSNETNYISILEPTQTDMMGMLMTTDPNKSILMLQDCYMDALGGMLVYAPIDVSTMRIAASGEFNTCNIPILPSGFTISTDGGSRRSDGYMESDDDEGGEGGSIVTVAFQILVSGRNTMTREMFERSVGDVSGLISNTVDRIKVLLNCSDA
ncbi:unnamed protein product [Cochlearia groenlandica]